MKLEKKCQHISQLTLYVCVEHRKIIDLDGFKSVFALFLVKYR